MPALSKQNSRSLTPKRSYKIKRRSKFKDCTNVFKPVQRKRSDMQVRCMGEACRQTRLADPTEAETAFADILASLSIAYEREKFIQNGDRFILVDYYLPQHFLAVEIDGSAHLMQPKYDIGRDKWLLDVHKIKTIRLTNNQVLKHRDETIEKVSGCLFDMSVEN